MANANPKTEQVLKLYETLILAWNHQDARKMGEVFSEAGNVVGFDGSQLNGPAEIVDTMGVIFSQHPTARFVSIVREIRFLTEEVALLRASVGMVPRQGKDINPSVNAIQSLVAEQKNGEWRVSLFHNTPAAWHGRPEDQEKLSQELRQVVASGVVIKPIA
jgi:uncharacterized protein (TIGR02246 family)